MSRPGKVPQGTNSSQLDAEWSQLPSEGMFHKSPALNYGLKNFISIEERHASLPREE